MFLMASILGGLGLVVIPVLVHLLHRQKVTPVAWGAMQFLLESPLRLKRRRRIDNWLLMLVRMAIVALVALILARPVARLSELRAAEPADVAVVIDHSMTMGMRAAAGGGTSFDRGIDIAQRVARMLPSSGTMSVVLAENVPRVITATPLKMGPSQISSDGMPQGLWADAIKNLREMKPGMTKGNIPAAVAAAREALSHGYNSRKVILVVSDDQRTNWDPGAEQPWRQATGIHENNEQDAAGRMPIFAVPVGPAETGESGLATAIANALVRGVTVLPAFLGVHRPSEVFATVANSGGTSLSNVPIVLEVDGKAVANKTLANLAVGDSTTVRFDYFFPESGSHWVRVKVDQVDGLDADNAATAAVSVQKKLPVLVVDGQLSGAGATSFPQATFLLLAMQPVDASIDPVALIEPKVISVADFSAGAAVQLNGYPVVVLNDVPRISKETMDRLADYARSGNGVWIILGPRTEQTFINDVLARGMLAPLSTRGVVDAPKPQDNGAQYTSIDIRDPSNPAMASLMEGDNRNPLSTVGLRNWWQLTPVSPDFRTILATSSGDPLVMEMDQGKVGGKVLVWGTAAGNLAWSNLPLAPYFVPLVQETLFHLASGRETSEPRQVAAGQPLIWTGPLDRAVDLATLECPDGSTRTLQAEVHGDHYFVQGTETQVPGLYVMRFNAPARAGAVAPPPVYFSVNIDPEELDPAVLSAADLDWYKEHGFLKSVLTNQALGKSLDATNAGYEWWWVLGLTLLGMLVLEVLLTYRHVRQQSGEGLEDQGLSVAPAGPVSGRTSMLGARP